MNQPSENLNDLLKRLTELNQFLVARIKMTHTNLALSRNILKQQQFDRPATPLKRKVNVLEVALLWQEHLN